MCLNLALSLGAWIVGSVGCVYLRECSHPAARILALFLLFGLIMQPLEACLWLTKNHEVKRNARPTLYRCAFAANVLQPVVLALLALAMLPAPQPRRRIALISVIILYLGIILFVSLGQDSAKLQQAPRPCHRDNIGSCGVDLWWWRWSEVIAPTYVVCLFLVIVLALPPATAVATTILLGLPLGLSVIEDYKKGLWLRHSPSLWCLLIAAAPYGLLAFFAASSSSASL